MTNSGTSDAWQQLKSKTFIVWFKESINLLNQEINSSDDVSLNY